MYFSSGMVFALKQVLKRKSGFIHRPVSTTAGNLQKCVKGTVDAYEIIHFDKWAETFWEMEGAAQLLHTMNKLRVPFICEGLVDTKKYSESTINYKTPLEGLEILDAGCGAGILTEALSRVGAKVTGIDASKKLIDVADAHVKQVPAIVDRVTYVYGTIEDFAPNHQSCYDAVVLSDVIEHVTEKEMFLEACALCVKPGGSMFITTPNRTIATWISFKFLAEYVYRLLSKGTHKQNKCIKPHELSAILEKHGCSTKFIKGMYFNFLQYEWEWTAHKNILYALHAIKKNNI